MSWEDLIDAYVSIKGIEARGKPFPILIERNSHLFEEIAREEGGLEIIDIGAGLGRFMSYFLGVGYLHIPKHKGAGPKRVVKIEIPVRRYIAIEPEAKFIPKLKEIKKKAIEIQRKKFGISPNIEIINESWENVRENYIDDYFDITILWDVVMFMDLTEVHRPPEELRLPEPKEYKGILLEWKPEGYLYSILKEVQYWVGMTEHYILFSLHPMEPNIFGLPVRELKTYYKRIMAEFEKYCNIVDKLKTWPYQAIYETR